MKLEINFVLCSSLIMTIDTTDFYYIVPRHLATCFTTSGHSKALKIYKIEITIAASVVVGPITISERKGCVLLSRAHLIFRQNCSVLYFVQKRLTNA